MFSRLCFSTNRVVIGRGLATILLAPTVGYGQFSEVQQLSYWDHDSKNDAVVPLQLDSRVFRVEVGFDMFDPASLQLLDENGGAYINVLMRIDPFGPWEWVVQNEFESVPDETWFDMGNIAYEFGSNTWFNGMTLFECEMAVTLTEEPVPFEPIIEPGFEQLVFIEPTDNVFSDQVRSSLDPLGAEYVDRIPWEYMSTRIGEGLRPDRVARIARSPKNLPPIMEKLNECAPGATARSLTYLSSFYGFDLGTCPQCLHAEYVIEMETDSRTGTYDDNALEGRRNLHGPDGRNLPVRSVDSAYVTNTLAGFQPAIDSVMDQIQHGHDVEVTYSYKSNGKTCRHRAMIAKVEQFDREDGTSWYRIWTIDDNNQRDTKAANDLNCLIVNESGTIFERAHDGSWIRYGKVDSFSFDQFIPRLTDVNDDGKVDGADLAPVLGGFNATPDGSENDCDFSGDGEVDGMDLAILLGFWGMTFDR